MSGILSDLGAAGKGITTSPVLMVGVAGAALIGVVWIASRNRPASEVVGGNLPFSWDALQNWLSASNGGPGGPTVRTPTTTNDPTPVVHDPAPTPQPVPIPHICYGPDNRPMPCPPGPEMVSDPDETPTEQAYVPNGVGGGRARLVGFSPDVLYSARYNALWAQTSTEHREDHG